MRQEEDRVGWQAPGPVLSLRTDKERGLQCLSLTVLGDDVGFRAVLYGALCVVDDPGHLVHRVELGGVPCVRTTPNLSDSRPGTRPSRMPQSEAEAGRIAITILLALSEKFQEGD